jgi:hypothetical protein
MSCCHNTSLLVVLVRTLVKLWVGGRAGYVAGQGVVEWGKMTEGWDF